MLSQQLSKILGELFIERHGLIRKLNGRISCDSREVLPGGIFVAIKGVNVDGHKFIPEVLKSHVSVVVHEDELTCYPVGTTFLRVTDSRRAFARLVRASYHNPDEIIKLIGVTGTNGKTTTVFLLQHLFDYAKVDCGLISTVEYRDGKTFKPSTQTTPNADVFFPMLDAMRSNGMKTVAMELSSHALEQSRTDGARFRCAIFTNLTGDHLDYHDTMENYYQTKKLLFSRHLDIEGTAIINIDDPAGLRLRREVIGRHVISFGQNVAADWRIANVELKDDGTSFELVGEEFSIPIKSHLIGMHNIYNLAGAILAALDYGISVENITEALQEEFNIPGRLECHKKENSAEFFVDYAHTDDALKRALECLRPITKGKLITVFGAGGNRDKSKRSRMGEVASSLSDMIILTNDNPRFEDPIQIINDISSGISSDIPVETILDRRAAILKACQIAKPGDVVLIAGKGHEKYQEAQGEMHAFNDGAIIDEFLAIQ
jgi:UDP-N-acetylmuramoyl-L-alanyl-D-glutamate--2,6-diaminopimelate ligase